MDITILSESLILGESRLALNLSLFRCFALYKWFGGIEKVYFFQDGYLRTSSKEFSMSNIKSKFIHLTNDAIQK